MRVRQEIFLPIFAAVGMHRAAQQVGRYLMAAQSRQICTTSIAPPLPSAGFASGALSEHDKLVVPLSRGEGGQVRTLSPISPAAWW